MTTKIRPFAKLTELKNGPTLAELADKLGFTAEMCSKWGEIGITTAPELREAILTSPKAAASYIELAEEEVRKLADTLTEISPSSSSPEERQSLEQLECGFGAVDVDEEEMTASSRESPDFELASAATFDAIGLVKSPDDAVGLMDSMPPIRSQGNRPTCVAFAVARCWEHRFGKDLSEHFIYWNCKEIDGIPNTLGTKIATAVKSVKDLHGATLEDLCGYETTATDLAKRGSRPSDAAYKDACGRKIVKGIKLESSNLESLQRSITNGYPFALTIPVFDNWFKDLEIRRRGLLRGRMGLDDPYICNHAITVVGYVKDLDDQNSYFIFDNSWGTGWAPENPYGAGRGLLTFDFVKKYCGNKEAFLLQVQ